MTDYDKDTLVREHIGLAKSIAVQQWRTATYALEMEEMLSLAYLGLVDAADRWPSYCNRNKYDPEAVEFFKIYARRRIHGTIRDAIRANDWATRTLRDKAKKLKQAGQDEGASLDELAERSGLTVTEVSKTLHRMSAKPISLDQQRQEDGIGGWSECFQYRDPTTVDGSAFENDMLTVAMKTIRELPLDQQVVLALHYYQALEIRSVAKTLGITESRASQLHTKAVLSIRRALKDAATEKEYN